LHGAPRGQSSGVAGRARIVMPEQVAVSTARKIPRNELVVGVLQAAADQWAHEATMILRVTRRNPFDVDADRKGRG